MAKAPGAGDELPVLEIPIAYATDDPDTLTPLLLEYMRLLEVPPLPSKARGVEVAAKRFLMARRELEWATVDDWSIVKIVRELRAECVERGLIDEPPAVLARKPSIGAPDLLRLADLLREHADAHRMVREGAESLEHYLTWDAKLAATDRELVQMVRQAGAALALEHPDKWATALRARGLRDDRRLDPALCDALADEFDGIAIACTDQHQQATATTDVGGMLGHSDLVRLWNLDQRDAEALRKRLERWRPSHRNGEWITNPDRRPREPLHLYSPAAVEPLVKDIQRRRVLSRRRTQTSG